MLVIGICIKINNNLILVLNYDILIPWQLTSG